MGSWSLRNLLAGWWGGGGAIAGGGTDGKGYFYPLSYYQFIESKNPVLIDCSMGALFSVYLHSPHLRIVIDRGAQMFSNGQLKIIDKDGQDITDDPKVGLVMLLLRQPTPLHNTERWLMWLWVMKCVYGTELIYKNAAFAGNLPKTLWPLFSGDIEVIPTGKMYDQIDLKSIIQEYRSLSNGRKFKPEEIIQINTGIDDKSLLIGGSKIPTLQYHISNANAALRTRNILLTQMGPKGILSSDAKDSDGAIPLGKEERERLEKQYLNDYGIGPGQSSINITTASLKWQPMSFPTKDLMAFEETEDNFQAICAAFGMYRNIFPSTKDATFENQNESKKGTYQDTIIPAADNLAATLTEELRDHLPEGARIILDYSWLAVLQEDEGKNAVTLNTRVQALATLVDKNIANPAQARQLFSQITGHVLDESLMSSDQVLTTLSGDISPLLSTKFADALTFNRIRALMGEPPLPAEIGDVPIAILKQAQQQKPGNETGNT